MRLISDETLDLIAGGYSSDGTGSIPIVTIVGNPPEDGSGGGGWGGSWGGGGDPGSGTGGGGSTPTEPPDCSKIHNSPPPPTPPTNVPLNQLRNTMVDLAGLMKDMDPRREHGILVVSDANGFTRVGEWAHGDANSLTAAVNLQAGEKIVGWIHSHPSLNGVDQRLPSSPASNPNDGDNVDTVQWARIAALPAADPGMMAYIYDVKSGKVYEYPANGAAERSLGNNVSDDTPATC
jgi:hypothetical protein